MSPRHLGGAEGLLVGRYSLGRKLREGSSAVYFEAFVGAVGAAQRVLIKTLVPALAHDAATQARMRRELSILQSLSHPCIIPLREMGFTSAGVPFAVLEYVEGVSWAEVLATQGPISMTRLRPVLEQLGGLLAEIHTRHIVHRDLRPDNVLLLATPTGERAWLMGFELARNFAATEKTETLITQRGMVLGSPPYMSPEQFMGKELDCRSDIYSLAVTVYQMLSGQLPFVASTPWEWATKHISGTPTPLRSHDCAVSEATEQALFRALAKNPEVRPASVPDFLALLLRN